MVKFLVIRFSSIGDIVLTTPLVRGLKNQVEDSEVHFLTKPGFEEILTENPHITKIHTLSEKPGKTITELSVESFDYIIDLQNNIRSRTIKRALKRMFFTVNKINMKKWLYVNFKINKLPDVHIVDRYMATASVFDVQSDDMGLDYFIPETAEVSLSSLGETYANGFIAIAIGARHNTKKIPPEQISEIILKLSHPVILIGGPEDADEGERIKASVSQKTVYNGCGTWSINQSASIIKQAHCVVAPDTGMMHIAAAFKKKLITVWGNTTPSFGMYPYLPDSQSVDFEVEDLKCRPCSKLGKESCPKKHFKCMKEHDFSEISKAANKLY